MNNEKRKILYSDSSLWVEDGHQAVRVQNTNKVQRLSAAREGFATNNVRPLPVATTVKIHWVRYLETKNRVFTDILAGFTFNNRVLRFPAIVLKTVCF